MTVLSVAPAVEVAIQPIGLRQLTETPRFSKLNKYESYFKCTQYDHLKYDWDGNFRGYGEENPIEPSGWIPMIKMRRPSTRSDLAKTIVTRFTALLFGRDKWPEINVHGDPEAEDYVKTLVEEARLTAKMVQARNLGGAQGTSCLSFAYINGKPRVQVHNAKNCHVLRWEDPSTLRVGAAMEAYSYKKQVLEGTAYVTRDFYYVRYWDEYRERVYKAIPVADGNKPEWHLSAAYEETVHDYGFCPFYWTQNIPSDEDVDGESDFEGQTDKIDELSRLRSATTRGTIANVDPTLVIREDPALNTGKVRKGSGQAIFARGGAEYLEFKGESIRSSMELGREIKNEILDTVQMMIGDGAGRTGVERDVSGEFLKVMNSPMLAKADIFREQYGMTLQTILRDMLVAARRLTQQKSVVENGQARLVTSRVNLPPRIEVTETNGVQSFTAIERTPGVSDNVTLAWGDYYPHTWADRKTGVECASKAIGDGKVMSNRTAIKLISGLTGVEDVDKEIEEIETDQEVAVQRAQQAFAMEMESKAAIVDDDKQEAA